MMQENRRRERPPSASTELDEQQQQQQEQPPKSPFTDEKLILRILSFVPQHQGVPNAHLNFRVVALRRINSAFQRCVDGSGGEGMWTEYLVSIVCQPRRAACRFCCEFLQKSPPPLQIWQECVCYGLRHPGVPATLVESAMGERNKELVLLLVKDARVLGSLSDEQRYAVLKFAIDLLSASCGSLYPEEQHQRFFDAITSLPGLTDSCVTTDRTIRYGNRDVPILRSCLEYSLFCFEDEAATLYDGHKFDDFFKSENLLKCVDFAGLALVPRIPLAAVQRLIQGPSAGVVAHLDHLQRTMLGRLVLRRHYGSGDAKLSEERDSEMMQVISILAAAQRSPVLQEREDTMRRALRRCDHSLVEVLLDAGWNLAHDNYLQVCCDLETIKYAGDLPREQLGHPSVLRHLKLLIEHGAKWRPNAVVERYFAPPMHACGVGDLELLRQLVVQCGCDVNCEIDIGHSCAHPGIQKWTALGIATMCGSMEMCKFLVEHGASVDPTSIKNANERTESRELTKYLKEQRARQQQQQQQQERAQ